MSDGSDVTYHTLWVPEIIKDKEGNSYEMSGYVVEKGEIILVKIQDSYENAKDYTLPERFTCIKKTRKSKKSRLQ